MRAGPSIRRRRRRGGTVLRWLARIAVVVIVFGLGVAFGQALEDRPEPSRPITSIATIQPWTQTDRVETRTVTVTP